jgi:hypothetical protein
MPIVGQDDKYFLTDKGGRVAKSGLSDEKRIGYEQQLVAPNFGELAKQPGALPEEASPFPKGAPNMTPVPMQSTIQAPQGGSIWDQAAAYTASSPTQLNLTPQQQASIGGTVDLSGVNPQPQPMGFDPSIEKGLIQGYEMQQAGARKQANAIEKMNIEALKEQQALEREMAMTNYDIMRTREKRDEAAGLAMQKLEQARQDYANAKIDPDRFFGNDTGKRLLAGIAIAFGAIGQGLTGAKDNAALNIITKAIDRDIDAQEKNRDALGKRIDFERLGLQDIKSRYDDSVKGKLAQKAMSIEMAQMKIDQIGKRYGTEEAQAKAQSLIGQLEVQKQDARFKLAQLEADAVTASQPDREKLMGAEDNLRKEREGSYEYKQTSIRRDAYATMSAADEQGKGPGDLAFIFSYMKLLDPGSTVREGEFANASNAGGVSDKIRNEYNRILNGGWLNEEQRKKFLAVSKGILDKSETALAKKDEGLRKIVEKRGLNPEMVFLNAPARALAPGNLNSLSSLTIEGEEPNTKVGGR